MKSLERLTKAELLRRLKNTIQINEIQLSQATKHLNEVPPQPDNGWDAFSYAEKRYYQCQVDGCLEVLAMLRDGKTFGEYIDGKYPKEKAAE